MGTLDFRAAEFREPHKVDQELRRVYDICAGCRRCRPLCPSFKVLFDRLDVDAVDRDVEKLPAADVKEVTLPTQRCCGMPYPDGGAVDEARALVRDNVRSLAESARQGCDIPIQGSDGRTQRLTTSAGALSPTTRTASPPARAARSRCVSDTCSSCRRGNRIVIPSSHGLHSRTRPINAAKNGGKHGRN